MHWSFAKIPLPKNVVDGFQGDEWLVDPFQEEAYVQTNQLWTSRISTMEKFSRKSFEEQRKKFSTKCLTTMYFSPLLFQARRTKARTTSLFLTSNLLQ
jgi:hypothetical protein